MYIIMFYRLCIYIFSCKLMRFHTSYLWYVFVLSEQKYKRLYNKCILSRRSEQALECCSLRLVTNAVVPSDRIRDLEGYTHYACRNRTTYLKSIIQAVCLQIGPLVWDRNWTTSYVCSIFDMITCLKTSSQVRNCK